MAKQLKERIQVGIDKDGNPIYKWATGYSKQDLFLSIAALLNSSEEKTSAPLFGDFLIHYVQTYKSKQSDLTKINRDQFIKKHIIPRLGNLRLDEISTPILQEWFDELCDAGYARETILKIKHIISPAFDCAVEDEIIIKNPVQSKRLLINTDKGDHHKAIPPELMKHVRKHMDSLPRRERCIVALLCYTGLRFEEILGLQWNDIDLEAREIKIQRAVVHPTRNQPLVKLPKTKASLRTIPLADKLVEHLMPFEQEGFILGGGKPLTYQQKKMAFEKIRERLGLEGYSAHDFRHTCATEWKEHGMTLQEVSKLLGHTNTTVTERCYVEFRKHGMNKARIVMNTI
jgi:integrase